MDARLPKTAKKIRKRRVTLHDVARHANVSPSTVSRALTGSTAVTPDKMAAIRTAIDELGYRPDEMARGLANGSSNVIGVLTQHLASPFYGEMITGIEYGLRGSGYSPMIIGGNWELPEQLHALDIFMDRRVSSLIILGGNVPNERLLKVSEEVPLIIVGCTIPGLEAQCIRLDNFHGGYIATKHLIEQGHRHIAHVSGLQDQLDSIERQNGYCRALIEAGIQVNPQLIVSGNFREQSGILALEMLLTRGVTFTAIFVANDQMAAGVQLALYRRGIRIPEEMSIIGYDDLPSSAYSRPPLTTIRQPAFEMGSAAAQGVLEMLAGREPQLPALSTSLVVRQSVIAFHSQYSPMSSRART